MERCPMRDYSLDDGAVSNALKDEPELLKFWNNIKNTNNFYLHLTLDDNSVLTPKDIKTVISLIKSIEDREGQTSGAPNTY
jgi:hypothetical protein